jgi:hypothetical protein
MIHSEQEAGVAWLERLIVTGSGERRYRETEQEVPSRKKAKRGEKMKFAKAVYWVAGIWGVLVLTPLYFMFDVIGRKDPPVITHPGFYYGFVGVGLAWQIAFLVIARDPMRLRPMMIPSMVEKFSYVFAVVTLVIQGRMHSSELAFAGTDLTLGILFVAAYWKSREGGAAQAQGEKGPIQRIKKR